MKLNSHIFFEFKNIFDLIEENIAYIESGDLGSGNVVYCSKILQDVFFLEGPDLSELSNYHKARTRYETVPFSGSIRYRTFDGEVGECPVGCIAKISSGNFFSSYEVKNTQEGYKEMSTNLTFLARSNGFRVEVLKSKESYLLRFFGDSQEIVDQFVDCIEMVVN